MRVASVVGLLVFQLCGLLPAVAAAQDTPTALSAGPTPRVRPGLAIWVTTFDGRELSGHVRSVSASTLEMTGPGGDLSMPLSDVRTIEERDSRTNGARWGALIGGVSLGAWVGLLSYGLRCERDCGAGYSATRDTIEGVSFGVGMGAGGGALIGLLIDHLIEGREVVYAAGPVTQTSWEVRPAISKRGLRVHTTVRW